MSPDQVPQNLPVSGKSLLTNLEPQEERKDASLGGPLPVDSPPAAPLSPQNPDKAEDIFSDLPLSRPGGDTEDKIEEKPGETIVETPSQGFRKVLITISFIIVAVIVLSGLGYYVYRRTIKTRLTAPSPNLNVNVIAPLPPVNEAPPPSAPPVVLDSDNDGLSDEKEREVGTDPLNPDTDGDRLFDREEVEVYKTDPLNKDTDGDTYEDGAEVQNGYDPKGPGKLIKIPAE